MIMIVGCSAKQIRDSILAIRQAPEAAQESLLLSFRKRIVAAFGSISVPPQIVEGGGDGGHMR